MVEDIKRPLYEVEDNEYLINTGMFKNFHLTSAIGVLLVKASFLIPYLFDFKNLKKNNEIWVKVCKNGLFQEIRINSFLPIKLKNENQNIRLFSSIYDQKLS